MSGSHASIDSTVGLWSLVVFNDQLYEFGMFACGVAYMEAKQSAHAPALIVTERGDAK